MKTVWLVPTTHMDIDYTGAPSQSMARYDEFVRRAVERLEANPDERYSIQLVSAVKHALGAMPELKPRIQALLASGQLEICANWGSPHWSELPDELLVRSVTTGLDWLEQTFGYTPPVLDNGELADPTPQLAQVLAKAGVPFMHSAKVNQLGDPYDGMTGTIRFAGLDGSEILFDLNYYNHSHIREEKVLGWPGGKEGAVFALNADHVDETYLLTTGGDDYDDSFPLYDQHREFLNGWNNDPECAARATFRYGTYTEYFRDLAAQPGARNLPLWTGHTEHGEILYWFQWNRHRDRTAFVEAIRAAEWLATICALYGLADYPHETFASLWQDICFTCTHNWGFRDIETNELPILTANARAQAESLRDRYATLLANAANTPLRFNSLPVVRDGVSACGWNPAAAGNPTPEQPQDPITLVGDATATLQTDHWALTFGAAGLANVTHRTTGQSLFKPLASGSVLDLCSSYDESMGYQARFREDGRLSEEELAKAKTRYAETDHRFFWDKNLHPIRTATGMRVEQRGTIGGLACTITYEMNGEDLEIGFTSTGAYPSIQLPGTDRKNEWTQRTADRGPWFFATLEVDLPANAPVRTAIPFGAMTLPSEGSGEVGDVPAHFSPALEGARGWYDLFEERWHKPLRGYASARMMNPTWTEIGDPEKGTTLLWLQRQPYANMLRHKDHPLRFSRSLWQRESDSGIYAWRFRLGNNHHPEQAARDWNQPAFDAHPISPATEKENTIPSHESLLAINAPNVILTGMQMARDGAVIVRLYECEGQATTASLTLGGPLAGKSLTAADMRSQALEDAPTLDASALVFLPYEIKTLRLEKTQKNA